MKVNIKLKGIKTKEKEKMKSFEIVGRVHTHTHTQANLENIKINKVKRNFSLYINVYKTDQLVI